MFDPKEREDIFRTPKSGWVDSLNNQLVMDRTRSGWIIRRFDSST